MEDINNMLNSGEVPNIFPNDERVAICEVRIPMGGELDRVPCDVTNKRV